MTKNVYLSTVWPAFCQNSASIIRVSRWCRASLRSRRPKLSNSSTNYWRDYVGMMVENQVRHNSATNIRIRHKNMSFKFSEIKRIALIYLTLPVWVITLCTSIFHITSMITEQILWPQLTVYPYKLYPGLCLKNTWICLKPGILIGSSAVFYFKQGSERVNALTLWVRCLYN